MWGLVDIFCVVYRNLSAYIRTSKLIMQGFQCPFIFSHFLIQSSIVSKPNDIFLPANGLHESNQCTYLSLFFQSLGPSNRSSFEWLMRYTHIQCAYHDHHVPPYHQPCPDLVVFDVVLVRLTTTTIWHECCRNNLEHIRSAVIPVPGC